MTAEARIRIVADSSAATAAVLEFASALDTAGAHASDLANEMLGELLPAWSNASAAIIDIGKRIYAAAEAYDQLSDIQSQLGNSSNELASAWTQGLIPALELAQARGRALSAGLELTDQQFAAVAAAAQVYAQRTGTDGAQAVERLSNALVSGSERALRPFGIQLQEGASRAQNTATALDQLSQASERNRANIEASTGGFDRLGAQVTKAKDAAISFYGGITNFVLDGLFKLADNAERAARAIGRGDSGGLTQAFFDATDASHSFAEEIPGIGQHLAGAARAARDYAASLIGISRASRAAASAGRGIDGTGTSGMGARAMLDRELNEQRYNDERRRDASRAEVERQRYEDALGGGGGGGGRGDPLADISRRAGAFTAEGLESTNAPGGTAGWEGGFTVPLGGSRTNREGARAGTNAGGRASERDLLRASRRSGGRDNTDFDAITTNAERTAESLSKMAEIGDMAFGALNSAVRTHVQAWIEGEESIGKALKGILSQTLQTMAIEAGVKAVMATAEGLFLLATSFGANPMAEVAFAAAAQYAAVAAIAGGGAALVGAIGGGGGGSRSSAGRGGAGRSSTRDLGADRSLGGQGFGGPSVTINIEIGRAHV